MKLLAVGTVAFDAIETPFGKTDKTLGGAATYIGLAASVMEASVGLVSVVGGDFPQEELDMMLRKNINIDGIEIIPNGKTFFWSGKYHSDLNVRDTVSTELNVLENFDPKIPEKAQEAEVLLLGNLHPAVQMSVLNKMKKRPKLVILDTMNFWMKHTWDLLLDIISKIDIICINDEEARQLSGEYSLVKAAQKIRKMGPNFVIIKKGEHGALLFDKNQIFAIPALPLEDVFDPTGAGDSFAGGFAAHLAKTQDYSFENMKTALMMGSAIASFTVEKFGTERLANISETMLKERIQEFKKLTAFEVKL
ncbi:PfkB family carbohydrate kinase [Riemerella anatipestifer]|uniref:PfkB family carbohydrate kinase n=1 Tax=Riemerella anatipestifer TaxID=34085 RepID=A0AAP6HHK1_RIEAN|nr:PfkB family carbohydrate kinase [Riemerella anatipestifer]MBT0549918.1 bifunctional hydroxymethylpyrimidine kinase/phosphomethylpyrimidine kinase [Riemerella anatipestifer]MBT0556621.1 bifunctional hydroxymethylpyrimidine kinase/phosphomethylpyrimidine kinase [Riemerella anatipestifer]MBT0560640.1 bifunctional hydroxymethylpyrimidine kinase/phosphomethylpyrimidine kinase [Riemerella anatipestifer]MCD5969219.1 PfkB family carbohydrate kinase [Riemerella anatipestifer]MCO7355804.1 PfkB family